MRVNFLSVKIFWGWPCSADFSQQFWVCGFVTDPVGNHSINFQRLPCLEIEIGHPLVILLSTFFLSKL